MKRVRKFVPVHCTVCLSRNWISRDEYDGVLIDIAARSNRVYSSTGLTRLSRSTTPAPPRTHHALSRQSGYCNSVSGNGTDKCYCGKWTARRQSVRPRDPTTTTSGTVVPLSAAATTNPNAILALSCSPNSRSQSSKPLLVYRRRVFIISTLWCFPPVCNLIAH